VIGAAVAVAVAVEDALPCALGAGRTPESKMRAITKIRTPALILTSTASGRPIWGRLRARLSIQENSRKRDGLSRNNPQGRRLIASRRGEASGFSARRSGPCW